MACIIFSLDNTAIEQWFSSSGWCQNNQEHLIKILRPRPYPASRTLGFSFFMDSPGLSHPAMMGWVGMGWGNVDSKIPFPFKSGVSGPKKAMPRDRQDFSLCLLKPSVGFISMGCSYRVG